MKERVMVILSRLCGKFKQVYFVADSFTETKSSSMVLSVFDHYFNSFQAISVIGGICRV